MTADAQFDLEELAAWEEDVGRAMALKVVEMFATSGPASVAALGSSLAARDREVAHREAHSLKSLARMLGAKRLGLLSESVERAAAAANWTLADALFEPIGRECGAAVAFLTARYNPG